MSWRPLIVDDERCARSRTLIDALVHQLDSRPGATHVAHVEQSLVHAQIALLPDSDDRVEQALARAVEQFAAGTVMPGLWGGAAGIGWAIAHLADGDEAEQFCALIEAALIRSLDRPGDRDYDLISGLVGYGVFALERGEAGRSLARRVLDELERDARPRGEGTAWHTSPTVMPPNVRAVCPDGHWNLGLAHGVPGVIGLLARYVAAGVEVDRARQLLDGSVRYLLDAEPPNARGRYPSWHPRDGEPNGRLAWCYGDLGISLVLLAAADARAQPEWRAEALALAHACASREIEAAHVTNTPICHGAFGAAHLFNRLHQATRDPRFAAAAVRWLDHALAMTDEHPVADRSLLEGTAGIALVLHAMISEVEPGWDRLLLIDVAPIA